MSTSRPKGKGKASSQTSSYYPTQWSRWEWNEQSKRMYRYRKSDPVNYEYEYDPPYEGDSVPRTTEMYSGSVADTNQYPGFNDYKISTSTSVDDVTQALTQTSLDSSSTAQQDVLCDIPVIKTRDRRTSKEKFAPEYRVHHQQEFKWGRIFKVLWAEPKGNSGNGDSDATISVHEGKHGEMHYEKVRRFVIVNQFDGHCICLPINTYGKQGVMKTGVHAHHHTIIHTGEPVYLFGEWEKGLTRVPIRMSPDTPRDKLLDGSRLNYAKPYTVEYNVKVCFIGKVHPDSRERVAADYNLVHPPVQAPRLPVPGSSPNTYFHADGGNTTQHQPSYSQYPLLNQAGQSTASSTPYTGASSIPQYRPAPYNQQALSTPSTLYPKHVPSTIQYDPATISSYSAESSATEPTSNNSQYGGESSSQAGRSGGDATYNSGNYDSRDPYTSQDGAAEQSYRSSAQPSSRGNQKYREEKHRRPR